MHGGAAYVARRRPTRPDVRQLPNRPRARLRHRPAHGVAYSMKFASFGQEWQVVRGLRGAVDREATSTSTAHAMSTHRDAAQLLLRRPPGQHRVLRRRARPGAEAVPGPHDAAGVRPAASARRRRQPGMARDRARSTRCRTWSIPRNGYLANWNTKPSDAHYLQQNGGEEYWGTIYHSEPIARDLATHQRLSTGRLDRDRGRHRHASTTPTRAPPRRTSCPSSSSCIDRDPVAAHAAARRRRSRRCEAWNQARHDRQRRDVDQHAMDASTRATRLRRRRVWCRSPTASHDFTGKATFNLLWHALDGTRGLVPCDRHVRDHRLLRRQARPSSWRRPSTMRWRCCRAPTCSRARTARTASERPTSRNGDGSPAQNKDWSDLDPIAERRCRPRAARQARPRARACTENRSTWMQSMDVGPADITGVSVLPPGESGFISKQRHLQPDTSPTKSPALRWLRIYRPIDPGVRKRLQLRHPTIIRCRSDRPMPDTVRFGFYCDRRHIVELTRTPKSKTVRRRAQRRRSAPHDQGMCRPEMLRATTSRWISDVPSKIV